MLDKSEILTQLLGSDNYEMVLVGFIFALLGAFLNWLISYRKRDKERNPVKFSFKYLLVDNIRRMIATFILIAIVMRFSDEVLGMEYSLYASFIVGFVSDKLGEKLAEIKTAII